MGWLETIVCWIKWAVQTAWSYGVDAFELVLSVLINAANVALALLPTAELGGEPNIQNGVLGLFNYVLPVGPLMAEFTLLMTCWILYRVYQWLLKWAKGAD